MNSSPWINHQFRNVGVNATTGPLIVPFKELYYVKILHCTFRNLHPKCLPIRNDVHEHDVYHIVLTSDGSGHFFIKDRLFETKPGQIFVTSPGERHSFSNTTGDNTEYCEVTFQFVTKKGDVLKAPFKEVLTKWSGQKCPEIPPGAGVAADLHLSLMREFEDMVCHFLRPGPQQLLLHAGLSHIFLLLILHMNRVEVKLDQFKKVEEYIRKNAAKTLSLKTLASIAHVSPNYLSRRFKSKYGMAPIVFQQQLKIQTAANLLRTTDHPIKDIAELTGFSDVYYFSRIFTKVQGMPPAKYRRSSSIL